MKQAEDDGDQQEFDQPVAGVHRCRGGVDFLPDHRAGEQDEREADPHDQREDESVADVEVTAAAGDPGEGRGHDCGAQQLGQHFPRPRSSAVCELSEVLALCWSTDSDLGI